MLSKRSGLLFVLMLTVAFAGLLVSSCASSQQAVMDYVESEAYYPAEEYAMSAEAPQAPGTERAVNGGGAGKSTLRYLIRNGSIDLTVKSVRDTIQEIQIMVKESGGIVSSSNLYEIREGQYGAYMTLRVPENLFDNVMDQLETYGKASNVRKSSDDVTMYYVDLESRLKNQKAQEKRLVEILEMAETVEEVLEVEREIFRVRGEIEAMTAQLTQLQDQVTFATINLSLREEAIPTETISPGAFENFGKRISQAFIGSINFLMNIISITLLVIVAVLPVSLVLGLVVVVIVLLTRKFSRRRQLAAAKKNEETKQD